MASLSDQIDRLSRVTREISATASNTAAPDSPALFTAALLDTHLGDLIRDIDPSELGLFRLQQQHTEPSLARTEFTPATPLRRQPTRREPKQDLDPEVYARAALRYIEQYEPIRPMPRAYDQIITILNRLNHVRASIDSLSASLEQVSVADKAPPTKVRVQEEERHIKDLQARLAELSKERDNLDKRSNPATSRQPKPEHPAPQKNASQESPSSPSSPQEEKFWTTPGEPSRVLRFSDNLLDEEVSLGDISTGSFGSPPPSKLKTVKLFGDVTVLDEPIVIQHLEDQPAGNEVVEDAEHEDEKRALFGKGSSSPTMDKTISPKLSPVVPPPSPPSVPNLGEVTETPKPGRQRKIRVNIEVERIISKIISTVGDIVIPQSRTATSSLSVSETIEHLELLAAQTPQPESPIASSSSISGEGNATPTFQQIQTAYLLVTLLSTSPHYSMPLNQVKENLTLKAESSGVPVAGQGTTRVLFQCVAKRLLKIDRGGREQIVKFDI
ncbi:hypothetical protein CPB84DRAFT_1963307 [Gymnopilus junonius]|uniref:Uncharacterized protein n=1 Tax=Gymnopilus junonius TaxID=109634 RepID=A0A9P5NLY8_GYMJU|nr:hypothetical protein CPB84DRAFT_1963307 [Gymnopilus junonius]